MSIRFRCHHCQQMLGIASSRAGAMVDCPGCGRSLRVPEEDGTVKAVPDAATILQADAEWMAAVEQLSALSLQIPESPAPSTSKHQAKSEQAAISEQFAEHAAGRPEVPPDKPLATQPSATQPSGRSFMPPLVTLLLGVLIGAILSRSLWPRLVITDPIAMDAVRSGDPGKRASDNVSNNGTDTKRLKAQGDPGVVSGTVGWTDAGNKRQPDAGALLLLLPVRHPGSLKIDGTSLRESVESVDQRAVAAALEQLGGSVARADTEGRFQLPRLSQQEQMLIAVSKHRNREDTSEQSRTADQLLSEYFESPSQFTGRLAIQHQLIPAVSASKPGTELPASITF